MHVVETAGLELAVEVEATRYPIFFGSALCSRDFLLTLAAVEIHSPWEKIRKKLDMLRVDMH